MLEGVFGGFGGEVDFAGGFVGITTVVECMFDTKLSCLDSMVVKGSKRIGRS